MKIAVATTDGVSVNEHFGKATQFFIYEVTDKAFDLLVEKHVEPYSTGNKSHTFDAARFQEVAKWLKGCKMIFVTKIGDEPASALRAMGIEPLVYEGEIKKIKI